jgi:AraC-like DNA-binding protein
MNSPAAASDAGWWRHQEAAAMKTCVPEGSARIAPASAIGTVLRRLGIEPEPLIAGCGVYPALFDEPEGVISYRALGGVVHRAAVAAACPHIGLLVGQACDITGFGLTGRLACNAPDVGTAVRTIIGYMTLFDRAAVATLEVEADTATFGYAILRPDFPGAMQICDGSLAIMCNIVRSLCGACWTAAEVRLPQRRPADIDAYRRFYRAPLAFDAGEAALVFPAAQLARPVIGADEAAWQALSASAAAAAAAAEAPVAERVRRRLRAALPRGWADEGLVAAELGLGRSTLRRQLEAEGTSFRRIAADVRCEMAKQLLGESDVPLGEIAAALGYAEPPVFTRAFRGWTGMAPSEWRQRQR